MKSNLNHVADPAPKTYQFLPTPARLALHRAMMAACGELGRTGYLCAIDGRYTVLLDAVADYLIESNPEQLSQAETCGKIRSGFPCTLPKGSICPDCGVSLHEFGGE